MLRKAAVRVTAFGIYSAAGNDPLQPVRGSFFLMTKSRRKAPAATLAHIVMALVIVGLFLFPFVAKFAFGNEPWFQVLFGNNRIFLFWMVGYGALIGGAVWADRNPDKVPSWLNKRL